jgi:hypothetical protein
MSVDLAVRPEPAVVTAEVAARKYEKFAEREPGAVPADSRTLAFHRRLTARYPNLTDLPVAELETSPSGLRHESMCVLSAGDGSWFEDPDSLQIEAVLGRLSAKNLFALLKR